MGQKAVKSLGYFVMIAGTIVIALLLALSAVAKYINPDSSLFMVALSMMVSILITLNMIICVIWLIKWRVWAIIPALAILSNWSNISAMYQFGNSAQNKTGNLKIASYNVCSFNNDYTGYSAKEVVGFVKNQEIDVLCMQEYGSNGNFNTDSVNGLFNEVLRYSYIPSAPNRNQLAIFSHYPIIAHGFVPFKKSANCAAWCDIVKGNDTIRIFNLHLQTTNVGGVMGKFNKGKEFEDGLVGTMENSMTANSKKRAAQALIIRRLINQTKTPIVVCGDFNDVPSSFTYHVFGERLLDAFKEAGHGYGATYRHFGNLFRIDYIFVDKQFEVCSYNIPNTDWSDHRPVIADLKSEF